MTERHTGNPINGEYTLCGRAYDDIEDDAEAPVFAQPGQKVTCEQCLTVIAYCKLFRNNIEREGL